MILDISPFIEDKQKHFKELIAYHTKMFGEPKLTIVTTQHSPATDSYLKNKVKTGESLGIKVEVKDMCKATLNDVRLALCNATNPIILQLPLRADLVLYEEPLLNSIDSKYDVDGLSKYSPYTPATALGIYQLITEHKHFKKASSVCLVGRSKLVNKPLLNALLHTSYSVCLLHSKSLRPVRKHFLGSSDIIVSATGVPGLIEPDDLTINATVIDVGISRNEEGKLCGDASSSFKEDKFRYATPVPGGVGKLTTTYLMYNVMRAYGML